MRKYHAFSHISHLIHISVADVCVFMIITDCCSDNVWQKQHSCDIRQPWHGTLAAQCMHSIDKLTINSCLLQILHIITADQRCAHRESHRFHGNAHKCCSKQYCRTYRLD